MNIQSLCGKLRFKICEAERQKRMWQMGLAGAMCRPPLPCNISQIIQTILIEPIIRELRLRTGKEIGYQHFSFEGYFRLLSDGKPFVVICLPNPGNGRVFVRFLNANGRPCTLLKELRDTHDIISFLQANRNTQPLHSL